MKNLLIKTTIFIIWTLSAKAQAVNSYTSDKVSFKSTDGHITFGGTLTLPEGVNNVPAVIIVSDRGKQDRDGKMAGHPLFAQIADYLSSNGIAVLRLDDRGVGKTTGDLELANTRNLADDALAALQFLKGINGISNKKIGLMGHGEGGAVISLAAAGSKDVAFLISLAGVALSDSDGAKTLSRLRVPILALHGDKDLEVAAEQNLDNWKKYTAFGGNRKVRTVLLSGLNHLFLPCKTCTIAEYPFIKADFSLRTLNVINLWLQANVVKFN